MLVGYNYPTPSNKSGNWIGPPDRQDRWPANYAQQFKELPFREAIESNLRLLKQNGVTVVRWFLLGNGFNYGAPPKEETARGPGIGGGVSHWTFEPPERLDGLFIEHYVQLLEIHRSVQMMLIPSLVSFEFFATYETRATAAGGRGDIATNWKKRNQFLFTVLGEFLKASSPYKDLIYAWEVMNEPAWDIRNYTPKNTGANWHEAWIDQDSLTTFITLALAWIEGHQFPSTVGHRFLSDLAQLPTGTKPQFHYYATKVGWFADPGQLPSAADARNSFVGEIGALIGEGFETHETPMKACYGAPWKGDFPDGRDLNPNTVVVDRLTYLNTLGYSLAMLWPDLNDPAVDKDDGLKLSAQKLAQISQFVNTK